MSESESQKRLREEDEPVAEEEEAKNEDCGEKKIKTSEDKSDAEEEAVEGAGALPVVAPPTVLEAAPVESETKAVVGEAEKEWTPVVFLGKLPNGEIKDEVFVELAKPFSPVVKMMVVDGKGTAFLQLQDKESVQKMVEHYNANPATVEGRVIFINSSPRPNLVGRTARVPFAAVDAGEPGKIILIKITQTKFPITAEVMKKVFALHAPVLRVVVFKKNDATNCLAEFATVQEASKVVAALQGQYIYAGCCKMFIQFSSQKDSLSVSRNSEYAMDYTTAGAGNFLLAPPSAHGQQPLGGAAAPAPGGYQNYGAPQQGGPGGGYGYGGYQQQQQQQQQGGGGGRRQGGGNVVFVNNLNEAHVTVQILFRLFSCYGDVEKLKILWEKRSSAMVQFTNSIGAQNAIQYLQGVELFGRPMRLGEFTHGHVNVSETNKGELSEYYGFNHPEHRFSRNNSTQQLIAPRDTLFVTSIPLGWTEDSLRQLLTVAGTILQVKLMPPKRYLSAIVTMGSTQEAINVLTSYHWYPIENNGDQEVNLRISFATPGKNQQNQMGGRQQQPMHQQHGGFQQHPPQQQYQSYGGYQQQGYQQYSGGRGQQQQHRQARPQHQQGGYGYQPQQAPPQQGYYGNQSYDAASAAVTPAVPYGGQQQQLPPPQQQQGGVQPQQPPIYNANAPSAAYRPQNPPGSNFPSQQPPPPKPYQQGYGSFLK